MDFAFSACLTNPSYIKAYSGSTSLGEFSSTDSIYIRNDLIAHPLKLEFYFENNEPNCYIRDNLLFQLTPSASYVKVDSLTETSIGNSSYLAVATRTVSTNFIFTGSLTSAYQFTNKYSQNGASNILINIDNTNPGLTITHTPIKEIYKKGDRISFNVNVVDSQSGLASLTITGGPSKINIYAGNSSALVVYSDNVTSTKNYTFTVTDLLENKIVKGVRIIVDSDSPVISDLSFDSSFRNLKDYYTFKVKVTDSSFEYGKDVIVTGDFSQINPNSNLVSAVCANVENSVNTKLCKFTEIESTLAATQTVNLKISARDSVGFKSNKTITTPITIDTTSPEIKRFEVLNSLGVSNVFSSQDKNVTAYLEVSDSSIKDVTSFRRIEKFGLIAFPPPNPNCVKNENNIKCKYDLSSEVSAYNGLEGKKDNFSVVVYDDRNNMAQKKISIFVDNFRPVVDRIELIETTCSAGSGVCDGIISSKESINFKIFIKDNNLFSGSKHFIYGDFSKVDFRSGQDKVLGSCRNYDSETVECSFNGIKVENGYLNRSVQFIVSDIAGNKVVKNYPIEIFAKGGEVPSSFSIPDLKILNPINRNVMKNAGAKAWFSGSLESSDPNIILINYQLLSCNDSQINPFLIIPTDTGLFPNEVVINKGQLNPNDFTLTIGLRKHPNGADMNSKTLACKMSVLKRDNTKIFNPEIVDFNVNFEFYGDLTGDILRAHATDIMSDISDAEFLGDWFDTTFEIYDVLNSACSVISKGDSLLSGISNVIYGTQWALAGLNIIDGGVTSNAIGTSAYAPKAILGETTNGILSPVKRMCDYVTCRNGGILTNALLGTNLGEGAKDLYDSMNGAVSSICIVGNAASDVEIIESVPTVNNEVSS